MLSVSAIRVFFAHSARARVIVIRTELILLGLSLSLMGCATKITARHSVPTNPDKIMYDTPAVAAEDGIGLGLDIFTPGLYADTEFAKRQYAPETLETKPSKGYFIPAGMFGSRGGPIELGLRHSGFLSQGPPLKVVDTAEVVATAIETTIAALTAVAGMERKAEGGLSSANACLKWTGRDLLACQVYEEQIVSLKFARTTLASGEVTPSSLTGNVLDKALKVLNDDIDYREKQYFRGIHNSKIFYFSQEASKPSTPASLNPAKDPGKSAEPKIDQ